jgi:tRNA-modifying protein YgfZ
VSAPSAEDYAAAREGAAFIALPDRALIAVTGPLRQKFLHNLLSNAVEGRKAGEGCRAALMDVKGRLLAFVRVQVTADAVMLEVPAEGRERIEALLVHYRVAAPVRFAAPAVAVLALLGPRALAVLNAAGLDLTSLALDAHATGALVGVDVRVGRGGDLPAEGYVLHVPAEQAPAVCDALRSQGAREISPETFDTLRVEDGRPWYGRDVTEENLLHETGLVSEYHSPTKGCYVGQEVIARLEARGGNVNKRLRGLTLAAPGEAGAPVRFEGKDIGRVTTAAVSPHRGPIALGYVHRNQAEPGSVVEVGGSRATVAALPFPR